MAARNARGGWDLTDDDVKEVMRGSFGGAEPAPPAPAVFLGGVCGDTTWRDDIAIPMLEAAGITYYNPQVPAGQWRDEMVAIEAAAKENSRYLLFAITGETRAAVSIQEATEHALLRRRGLFLVISDIPPGTITEGAEIRGEDLAGANRARRYLRNMIQRLQLPVPVYPAAESAVRAIIEAEAGRQAATPSGAVRDAITMLRRGSITRNLSYAEMSAMALVADDLARLFPEHSRSS